MLVTVAVCTWNRAGLLDRTLARLRELRVPAGAAWELVVVNNNCTDHTDEVIARHAAALPLRRIAEPTPGLSFARNAALAAAAGEYLLWTDDDVLVEPDWLIEAVAAMDGFAADGFFGRVFPWWEPGRPPVWYDPLFDGMFALLDLGPESFVAGPNGPLGVGANHGFRTAALRSLGGYRTDLGVTAGKGGGGEDLDVFNRAGAAGLELVYAARAVVRHYVPADRCTKRFYRRYTWNGSRHHLRMLRDEARGLPAVLGIPRYFYRLTLRHVCEYVNATLAGDSGRSFYYWLKLLRFAGLLWNRARGGA
jgi:glycosyltransferase involved in cell wall biosynthesis